MKKSAGIVLISGLILLFGLRLLGGIPLPANGNQRTVLMVVCLSLGALSVVVASALWRGTPQALAWYGAWAVAYLAGGGVAQVVAESAPLSHVVIWWVFVGAMLVAVGAHLRHALKEM